MALQFWGGGPFCNVEYPNLCTYEMAPRPKVRSASCRIAAVRAGRSEGRLSAQDADIAAPRRREALR